MGGRRGGRGREGGGKTGRDVGWEDWGIGVEKNKERRGRRGWDKSIRHLLSKSRMDTIITDFGKGIRLISEIIINLG